MLQCVENEAASNLDGIQRQGRIAHQALQIIIHEIREKNHLEELRQKNGIGRTLDEIVNLIFGIVDLNGFEIVSMLNFGEYLMQLLCFATKCERRFVDKYQCSTRACCGSESHEVAPLKRKTT